VSEEDVAMPLLLLAAVVVVLPFAKMALAPLDGAEKVTNSLAIGVPEESVTVTSRSVLNAVDAVVDWPLPSVARNEGGKGFTVRVTGTLAVLPAPFVTMTVN
jgi:hypothetical protein